MNCARLWPAVQYTTSKLLNSLPYNSGVGFCSVPLGLTKFCASPSLARVDVHELCIHAGVQAHVCSLCSANMPTSAFHPALPHICGLHLTFPLSSLFFHFSRQCSLLQASLLHSYMRHRTPSFGVSGFQ